MNSWILLFFSIISEVIGNILLKISHGLTKPVPTIAMGLCYATAIWLMGIVTRKLEVGITYAVWAGAGTALTAILGIMVFGESVSLIKISGVAFIVAGVVFLNLSQAT